MDTWHSKCATPTWIQHISFRRELEVEELCPSFVPTPFGFFSFSRPEKMGRFPHLKRTRWICEAVDNCSNFSLEAQLSAVRCFQGDFLLVNVCTPMVIWWLFYGQGVKFVFFNVLVPASTKSPTILITFPKNPCCWTYLVQIHVFRSKSKCQLWKCTGGEPTQRCFQSIWIYIYYIDVKISDSSFLAKTCMDIASLSIGCIQKCSCCWHTCDDFLPSAPHDAVCTIWISHTSGS